MTDIFIPENPPLMSSEDGRVLGEYLNRQMLAISTFVQSTKAGHAGLGLTGPTDIPDNVITQTPEQVTGYDSKNPGEVAATATIATNSIRFDEAGLWVVGFNAVAGVDQNSANITREVLALLHDDTTDVIIGSIAGGTIPRYGTFLTISGTFMARVTDQDLDDEFSIYVQTLSANTVTIETITTLSFYASRQSNYTYTGV